MAHPSPDTAKTTILIVDDETRMRRVIADYLHIKGYETDEAGDGVEALERFEAGSPDLVLLDVMMPRMDGFEVCRHIRAKSAVPIIMLTAKAEEEDELQGFGLGVDEYISKPFSLKILAARIEAVLRRRSAPGTTASPALPSGLSVDTGRTGGPGGRRTGRTDLYGIRAAALPDEQRRHGPVPGQNPRQRVAL